MSKVLGNEILELVGEIKQHVPAINQPMARDYVNKECGRILCDQQNDVVPLIRELRKLGTVESAEFADRLEGLVKEPGPAAGDEETDDVDHRVAGAKNGDTTVTEENQIPPAADMTAKGTDALTQQPATAVKSPIPSKPSGKSQKLKKSVKKEVRPTKSSKPPQAETTPDTATVAAKAPETTEPTSVPHQPQSSQVGVVNTEATSGNAIDKKEETPSSSSSSEKPPSAEEYRMVPVRQLDPHPLVKDFFARDESTFAALKESMFLRGFDHAHPLTVVEGPNGRWLVVDGNTRMAALPPDLEYVPVTVVSFTSDAELLAFVARTQLFRRNTSDPELLKAAEILIPIEEERAKERRGRLPRLKPSAPNDADPFMSSSKAVGLMLNRSKSTVDRIKRILRDRMMRGRVLKGKISIAAAYAKLNRLDRHRAAMAAGADVTGNAPMHAFTPMQIGVPPGNAADEKQYLVAESVLTLLAVNFPSEQFQTLVTTLELCDSEARTFILRAKSRRRKTS